MTTPKKRISPSCNSSLDIIAGAIAEATRQLDPLINKEITYAEIITRAARTQIAIDKIDKELNRLRELVRKGE